MREIVFFVASLAGAAILTALAVLNPEASLLWKNVLRGGIAVLAICALVLFIDIIRRRWPGFIGFAAKQKRVFVPPELTPERLLSFFEENTAIQATELIKDRIGQWMRVTGTVKNVGAFNGFFAQVPFENNFLQPRTWFDCADIYCYFRKPQINRLKVMKRGDKITVIGQIKRVSKLNLDLNNCELVDSNIFQSDDLRSDCNQGGKEERG